MEKGFLRDVVPTSKQRGVQMHCIGYGTVAVALVLVILSIPIVQGAEYRSPCYNSLDMAAKDKYDSNLKWAAVDLGKGNLDRAKNWIDTVSEICPDYLVYNLYAKLDLARAEEAKKGGDTTAKDAWLISANTDIAKSKNLLNSNPNVKSYEYNDAMSQTTQLEIEVAQKQGRDPGEVKQMEQNKRDFDKAAQAAKEPLPTEIVILALIFVFGYSVFRSNKS